MGATVFIILEIFFATRIWGVYKIVSIWRENMLGYLSADIICSEKQTVRSRKIVSSKGWRLNHTTKFGKAKQRCLKFKLIFICL